MEYFSHIRNSSKAGHGLAILYAALAGLVLSDIIPTPADALYFYLERNLRDKWKNNTITAKQYWTRQTLYYYILNPLWWILVVLITVNVKGDVEKKLKVAGILIGAGAAFGMIFYLYKQDVQAQALQDIIPKS